MKDKKLLVYPYDSKFTPVLRHRELLNSYDIVSLVSPVGWGLTGRDAGDADKSNLIGIKVSSNFDEAMELCDAVMFVDSEKLMDFEKYIMPKINKAIEGGKDILITIQLSNAAFNTISKKCEVAGVGFKYCSYPEEYGNFPQIGVENEFLHNIGTPVILIFGMGERTSKFELQLALREKIMNKGYKVSQIGTRGYCELLGFHSFPGFMYNSALPETNKIVLFNHFIKKMEKEEQPDVIIVAVPGGIMPFDNNLTNRFGILAYEVALAVAPDSTILSCHYAKYDQEYFTKMSDMFKYRFGCEVSCYNMANVVFDWKDSKYENRMFYTSVDSKFIDEKIKAYKSLNTPVFNVLNGEDAEAMAEYIINMLSDYSKTQCI